ncbi:MULTISPECIES: hypothetical protein [Nitrosomonas]|nr:MULTISPECIES: hypothetical protein [Nitrosomonas]
MASREDTDLLLVNQVPSLGTGKFMTTQTMNITEQQEKYLWMSIRTGG